MTYDNIVIYDNRLFRWHIWKLKKT